MPAAITVTKLQLTETMKHQPLRSMFSRNMKALKPEFSGLNESDFKNEMVRRYESEIVNLGLLYVLLNIHGEARRSLEEFESKLKRVAGPLSIDLAPFKKAKQDIFNLFIPHNKILNLKPNTSLGQLDSLFGGLYSAPGASSEKRRQLQGSVKREFYECIAIVEWSTMLRFPLDHRFVFDWFLDEYVLKYEDLLKHLRQSHSARVDKNEPDRAHLNRETFKRSYLNNTKHLWAKV